MENLRVSILIQAVGKQIWGVCDEIKRVEGIKTVNVVVGTFDAIVYTELNTANHLRQFLDSVHKIEGITRTETCIAL
ncbi:MAG: Lrp/AsnC ligand binding domain-containing protein [Candidatus Thorarchaeota archaeon]